MKKIMRLFLSLLICVNLIGAIPSAMITYAADDMMYTNNFDSDLFTNYKENKSGGGTPENTLKVSNTTGNGGFTGEGKLFKYDRTGVATWGGTVEAQLPSSWDLSAGNFTYLSFWAKGANENVKTTTVEINILAETSLVQVTSQLVDNDWEHFVLPLMKDGSFVNISNATKIRFAGGEHGTTGGFVIDNISLSNYCPQREERYRPYTLINSFEPNLVTKANEYAGWNVPGYSDYIKVASVTNAGVNGTSALQIQYSTATWYSGESFWRFPKEYHWRYVKYVTFDARGSSDTIPKKCKVGLGTGNVTSGDRYDYSLSILGTHWRKITIPISNFKKGSSSVAPEEITSLRFFGDDSPVGAFGNVAGNDYREQSPALLASIANTGTILIDNFTVTNENPTGLLIDSITLTQGTKTITKLSDGKAGVLDVSVVLNNYENINQQATVVLALYDTNDNNVKKLATCVVGTPKGIKPFATAADAEKTITESITITNPKTQKLMIFLWDDGQNMKPSINEYYATIY